MEKDIDIWMTEKLLEEQRKNHMKTRKEASNKEFANKLGLDFVG